VYAEYRKLAAQGPPTAPPGPAPPPPAGPLA
jgi:hypothetical protein